MTVWFYSDPHYNHDKIIEYCNRPFNSVEEMNEALVANYNNLVDVKDTVYVLGDFAMSKPELFTKKLNGNKFLIRGNHDEPFKNKFASSWGFGWVKDVYELVVDKQHIWLSHYSHQTWPGKHRGAWHLFGHSHGKLPGLGLSTDVGVDCWNYAPVSFEQLQILFAEKAKTLINTLEPKRDM